MQRSSSGRPSGDDEIEPFLRTPVTWGRTGELLRPFSAVVNGQTWIVRIGEFPEEPLYTLIVDAVTVGSFSTWPEGWDRPRIG